MRLTSLVFTLNLLNDLDHVLVREDVVLADLLRLVATRRPPDPGVLELLHDALVDAVAELLDRGAVGVEHDGLVVVRDLPFWLRVDA